VVWKCKPLIDWVAYHQLRDSKTVRQSIAWAPSLVLYSLRVDVCRLRNLCCPSEHLASSHTKFPRYSTLKLMISVLQFHIVWTCISPWPQGRPFVSQLAIRRTMSQASVMPCVCAVWVKAVSAQVVCPTKDWSWRLYPRDAQPIRRFEGALTHDQASDMSGNTSSYTFYHFPIFYSIFFYFSPSYLNILNIFQCLGWFSLKLAYSLKILFESSLDCSSLDSHSIWLALAFFFGYYCSFWFKLASISVFQTRFAGLPTSPKRESWLLETLMLCGPEDWECKLSVRLCMESV
jgi:hypothetical protein